MLAVLRAADFYLIDIVAAEYILKTKKMPRKASNVINGSVSLFTSSMNPM